MPKIMKTCKACGKEYEACHTPNPGVFRWRDIACSPECAQKYMHDVMVARGEIVEETNEPAIVAEAPVDSYVQESSNEADNSGDAFGDTGVIDGEFTPFNTDDGETPQRSWRKRK